MTKVVGLTGGIGSGKSRILKLFTEKGIIAYNADLEAKALMNTDKILIEKLKAQFGEKTYENEKLNRKYLADRVFKDKTQLSLLNAIVHPVVRRHFYDFLKKSKENFIIYENAILFENGFDSLCDIIITITAPKEDRIERVIQRDQITSEQVLQRMQNQWEDAQKIEKSDYVIYNDNWEETVKQFEKIYQELMQRIKS